MERRLFLKSAMAGSAVATAVGAGLLTPSTVFAASAKFKGLSNTAVSNATSAGKGSFKFKAPKIAENGAKVPMEVNASKMSDVTNISFLVQENSTPLAASFNLSGAVGFVSTRIKMGKTSEVDALVTAGGSTTKVTKEVKVTIGGCGG
ncbi:thiosulfate oxidation carrier protein SoxY [bacterium endosymbiont of Bathymodiolus sp. 5 South]|jgi:sulfur-oxidizing protein SoxY|uniref:thiosulfate oxidation carrier protein SoxY n=1 Tax=bacterium endosymbiont of Bathymodiolus sp. 5 South TaxID=1181670 RepID=UPI0010B2EAE5|nr:thiosulfate oxidation carrier protein SoxY [bacterium endosymbiont of Bathymodiolus sp. 5 South]CAC9633553.1 Sulfur oxidation protein SoxY [uncultured Gammaproteobacteria bacterium]CAC9638440.1 Sulfur oxidation protein SoxY [uncultured Gammaproteobacteria bacterium]CAC9656973.1 Sulfur oxidation protein SoxY [uncultured Gammaproteobacteria bacterium]SHN90088.1 Sulfur oxidation protein SoxY [bacterium endosymbiont of Bathymodiolus sp. 5 South]SSC08156.1 Sulfur oxidation protein SoxY [bacteriu